MPDPDAGLDPELPALLTRGVEAGIISEEQRARLLAIAAPAAARPAAQGAERPIGFNVVTVAYGLGALLVVFASGWFLVDQWSRLGAWGVLAVVAAYAGVLVLAANWLARHRFPLAADLATMLAVSLTPLVAWAFLSLTGRWPQISPPDPLLFNQIYMAWQWLVAELSLLLVALLVVRTRRVVTLTWPIALAMWAVWLHLGIIVRDEHGPLGVDRWLMLANGLALLFVAERVERWQRRTATAANVAAGGNVDARTVGRDFANAFWVTGLLATAVAYMAIWLRLDDEPSRHLLPLFSLGLVALSLYLRRRVVLLVGVAGILGYLAFLAEDVFKDYVSFPILLAGFGVLLILATVWTQTRFPALVERIDASRGDDERSLPWSPVMAALPTLFALSMAVLAFADAGEERVQRDFRERLQLLRLHSGSMSPERRLKGRAASPAPAGAPPVPSPGNLPTDSS